MKKVRQKEELSDLSNASTSVSLSSVSPDQAAMAEPEPMADLLHQWRNWADKVRADPSVPPPQLGQQVDFLDRHPEIFRMVQSALSGTAALQSRAAAMKNANYSRAVEEAPKVPSPEDVRSCRRAVGTTSAQLSALTLQRSQFEEIARENTRLKELTARSKSWIQASLHGQKPPPALRGLLLEKNDDAALEDKLDELDTLRKRFAQISEENEQLKKKTEQLNKQLAKSSVSADIRKQEKAEIKKLRAKVQEADRQKAELEELRLTLKAAAEKDDNIAEVHVQRLRAVEADQKYQDLQNDMEELKKKYENAEENEMISNSTPITPPIEPTLLDNTLLYLPAEAVRTLKLEPNMNDKGMGTTKNMWFGRVWELRQLLASGHKRQIKRANTMSKSSLSLRERRELSSKEKQALDKVLKDPDKKELLRRMAARWKGATLRTRCSLHVLEKLKFCNLRGTLIYAHGSGGCSWDNMRICRMIAQMGLLVIAPDGFSYPANSAMGKIRHKDMLPLTTADKDVDYWKPDLIYASGATGTHTYSTSADAVLDDPDSYRELYERCYQLRRNELHFVIGRLPIWTQRKGFFLGGTSEGAMTVARFDDQRYGDMVCGRFINSFSVEYCYFTPTVECGQIGGQLDVPTLNIIGTKDEYFGPENSVAKIVAEDHESGYGNDNLTGNAYQTFLDQKLTDALVCVLEDGVHGPCETHDNFLRRLFSTFFTRPERIAELDRLWAVDPSFKRLIKLQDSTDANKNSHANVSKVFVPKMLFPQKMTLFAIEMAEHVSNAKRSEVTAQIARAMADEEKQRKDGRAEMDATLEKFRDKVNNKQFKKGETKAANNYYAQDRMTVIKNQKGDTSYRN